MKSAPSTDNTVNEIQHFNWTFFSTLLQQELNKREGKNKPKQKKKTDEQRKQ